MNNMYVVLGTLLVSLSLNLYFLIKLFKQTPSQKVNKDLRLLQDLMSSGRALIRIERIAPNDYFVRSPRDL